MEAFVSCERKASATQVHLIILEGKKYLDINSRSFMKQLDRTSLNNVNKYCQRNKI